LSRSVRKGRAAGEGAESNANGNEGEGKGYDDDMSGGGGGKRMPMKKLRSYYQASWAKRREEGGKDEKGEVKNKP